MAVRKFQNMLYTRSAMSPASRFTLLAQSIPGAGRLRRAALQSPPRLLRSYDHGWRYDCRSPGAGLGPSKPFYSKDVVLQL